MSDDFEEYVTVKSRVRGSVGVMYDGRFREIDKKGLKCSRTMAELAVKQNQLRWNAQTGAVEESTVYIQEDFDTPQHLPDKPLDSDEVEKIKDTDGLGDDKIMVDGKFVGKKTINLKPSKQDYASNNQ
jgi:hypothetical protein